jgi:hypothetical protein
VVPRIVVVNQSSPTEYHKITTLYTIKLHFIYIMFHSIGKIKIVPTRRHHVASIALVNTMDDMNSFHSEIYKHNTQHNKQNPNPNPNHLFNL